MPSLTNLHVCTTPDTVATAAINVLTDAFRDGAVARWAEPDTEARTAYLRTYFTGLVMHALEHGVVRLADAGRRTAGVAVWYRYPQPEDTPDVHAISGVSPADPNRVAEKRLTVLETLLADRHPTQIPHWYLAYLGVHPAYQNQGVGTMLLTDQPDRDTVHAYLEANDPRNRALYRRHGFLDHGRHVTGHHGPAVYPMWRPASC